MDISGGCICEQMLPEEEGAAPASVDAEGMDTLIAGGSLIEAAGQQITELREEISRLDVFTAMLEAELVQGFSGQCPRRAGVPATRYEDALRVTFAVFRLCGMTKDWWLRDSEAQTLKNQPWTWIDFQEEFKREYIPRWRQFVKGLRVELLRALAPLPVMGFAVAVEATTRTEMVDQAVTQRKVVVGSATTPYKRPVQGP
ncbi:hypothetical protein M9H77_18067 [Catharanthus roseus]|uniref:Uncharacterized protein n=1 Tax=Catharanthus roseus TaxID=4058 RepID=A0ACC0B6F8_CATRO|nr:hypothetical protein M9H77_18067 [Catharanthus roseus]